MRIFHTLWTKPLKPESVKLNILLYTVSFLSAKQLGFEIVLHTDKYGAELLSHIPYDKVYIDLDDISDKYSRFYAYGKLIATSKEPLGSIHVDGDVFLASQYCVDVLNAPVDLVVQSIEHNPYEEIKTLYDKNIEFKNNCSLKWTNAFNCGAVKINNQHLKNMYLDTYFDSVEKLIEIPEYLNVHIPDVIPEQQFLKQITDNLECSYSIFLERLGWHDMIESGYTHLISIYKLGKEKVLDNHIKIYFPEIYSKLLNNKYYV